MTRALLINNDSDTWQELVEASGDAGLDVTTVSCHELRSVDADAFDVVILSGGWWYDDEIQHLEVYEREINLIRQTSSPVLGICIGMQLMQIAYSGQVQLLDEPQQGLRPISLEPAGQELLGWPQRVHVHKNHTMGALSVAHGFKVLARSPGHIEMIRHEERPLLGVQFHPEVGERAARAAMLGQLVDAVRRLAATSFVAGEFPQYLDQGLLIKPRKALDEAWATRLFESGKHTADIWAYLGPSARALEEAYKAFDVADPATYPSLLPDEAGRTIIVREREQLERLRGDIDMLESDPAIRKAYLARIDELLDTIAMYDASLRRDVEAFRAANIRLYGEPDPVLFGAAREFLLAGKDKALRPDDVVFKRQQRLHMESDGFYGKLFNGLPMPAGVITPELGDPIVRQMLHNLGADGYKIVDTTDGYWGVRASTATVVRPKKYALPAAEFIGTVGHEIGSHLLERLNGDRQAIRLLSSGLAGYEKGNEGRALLREQVAYDTWDDFAAQWRWYDILRRHIAISLADGLGGGGTGFGDVFRAMYDFDLSWLTAHAAPHRPVELEEVRRTTWDLVVRVLKGTAGQGGAYHKDIVYLEGNMACWRLVAESPDAVSIGDLGKVNIADASHLNLLASLH